MASRYIANTPTEQREMLRTVGASSIEDLLVKIPPKARLSRPLALPPALAEADLVRHLRSLAATNADADRYACFQGAGSYDHFIPSPINHLISRGEFFTAYTPYQPEASQGTLRTIYEYQTMIAELTGMDVANASIYDGASSLAEAALMAHSVTERTEIVLARGVNPLYRRVVATYCDGPGIRLRDVAAPEGVLDADAASKLIGKKTAALVIQSPNFYGCLEDVAAAAEIAHAAGALLVVVADPVNLGVLEAPGRLGADIVVGEGQGLGVPMSFGGPNLGVFAAKNDLVRRIPGRLVGATVDRDGQRGFVLTLQTREQHIRRAKATSNICTNVALCALMATIYMATLGKQGLQRVGELSTAKAHYAAEQLTKVPGVSLRFSAPFFKEFTLRLPKSPSSIVARLAKKHILPGTPLKTYDRTLADCLLVAVTEQRTREEIDAYAAALAEVLRYPQEGHK
jgi:glycine dehydrogenase subunit 1